MAYKYVRYVTKEASVGGKLGCSINVSKTHELLLEISKALDVSQKPNQLYSCSALAKQGWNASFMSPIKATIHLHHIIGLIST